MIANYLSAVLDLTAFGIFKIKNAILSSDKDDGITIEVSFNGGSSFVKVEPNTKFPVNSSTGKIQVKITFEDVKKSDIYRVKSIGYFQNLEVGTTVTFTKVSTSENFTTKIGRNGFYSISLPRGTYEVWYTNSKIKETLMNNFNPEITLVPTHRLDKETLVENVFRDIDWARCCVFDTFSDTSKMLHGNAIVDSEGDLSDGITNRKCRYWAIGFE